MNERLHLFTTEELEGVTLPEQFTFPFNYVPHKLCIVAAEHVKEHLASHPEWKTELDKGKMMGVLVVEKDGSIGYIAAFSGNICHGNNHSFFVPAVYDLLAEKGFFRPEEDNISAINRLINEELKSEHRNHILQTLAKEEAEAKQEIAAYKLMMKEAKAKRDALRNEGADTTALIAESQFQKAELKRIQARWQQSIDTIKEDLAQSDRKIAEWKAERQERSATLQQLIFKHFVMLNANGESRDLCEIFADTPQGTPPAGAGECAAPKLLQYAYAHDMRPISMGEFWVGESPKDVIRREGCFYPSCKAKCEPILGWMLQGLDVEPNPIENGNRETAIDIVYEDKWLLAVNKPEGTLSVPGKIDADSLQDAIEREYNALITHRLDMATSGILIFAKDKDTHKMMQDLFKDRKISKRYIAVVDGVVTQEEGTISLPLIANIEERPLQMVDYDHGKEAITHYKVIERTSNTTRIAFYPVTGRTHQLRMHSAHKDGLNCPIVGDTLYGKASERLMLHAESISFSHPYTGKMLTITSPCPF